MQTAVVGAARVVFGADTIQFDAAARGIEGTLGKLQGTFRGFEKQIRNVGVGLTAALTLPLSLMAKAAGGAASDFQAAMGNVKAAMMDASPKEIEALRQAALDLGPAFGKSAIETAAAIEALAKNGMSAAAILDGGLSASLKLAVLGQTDLASAANVTTDILSQFHLGTSELPTIIDRVSGALDASKLSFDGYRDAIGMVGGIAGGLGYQFEDMNTALAAIVPLMTGGSDAGTSFKTFLLSLGGNSKEAKDAMEQLGIKFTNVDGTMKSLSEIADVLNTKLAGLTQEGRRDALTAMFGTDGMRVALALMQAGADGIAKVKAQIDKASADRKIAVLMDGEAAATQRLASAWEKLKIAIGEAGLLQVMTFLKDSMASVIEAFAKAPPIFHYVGVAIGVVASAIGPLLLAAGAVVGMLAPFILGMTKVGLTFRIAAGAIGLLINPIGMLAAGLLRLGGTAVAVRLLGTALGSMTAMAGPIGLVATALMILIPLMFRAGQASAAATAASENASKAHRLAVEIQGKLATATGKARDAIMEQAKANRIAAATALQKAKADMVAAKAALAAARTADERNGWLNPMPGVGQGEGIRYLLTGRRRADALETLRTRNDTTQQALDTLAVLDQAITDAGKPTILRGFGGGDGDKPKRSPKDRDRANSRYADDLGRARVAQLQALAEETDGIAARHRADVAALEEDRAAYARQLAQDDDLSAAQRARLLAERDKEVAIRRGIIDDAERDALHQRDHELAKAVNEAEQDRVRATIDLADSLAGRRAGELRLLDLQRRQEEADLELILATRATSSAAWQNAQNRRRQMDEVYADRRAGVLRGTEAPGAAYLRSLDRSGAAIAESVESIGVSALQDLNSQLTDAVMNAKSLGDAFTAMGKRIIGSLLEIAIQQSVIKPLANSLFGASDAAGGRSGGLLASIGSVLAGLGGRRATTVGHEATHLPGFATGGSFRVGGMAGIDANVVAFRATRGEMVDIRRPGNDNGGGSAPAVVQLVVGKGEMFEPTVTAISGGVSVQTVTSAQRMSARRGRQRY